MSGSGYAKIEGYVVSEKTYDHKNRKEKFYRLFVSVKRSSGTEDIVPVLASERLLGEEEIRGKRIWVSGEIRTYNLHEGEQSKLIVNVFAKEMELFDETEECNDINNIYLEGYLCKAPVYRKTPLGREISDFILAVNRHYGKSDYIPCIAWGRNARYASGFAVGARVKVWGRIQSRKYQKQISEKEHETRTAYEVSISQMEVVESEEHKDQVDNAE